MQTFCISTLGCKVNQYESEQIASLLRSRGLRQVDHPASADLRIVNTCSVTIQAASKSRQTVRQVVRLPILGQSPASNIPDSKASACQRTIVTGCWATSDSEAASKLPGVNAVITHRDDVAQRLEQLIKLWQTEDLHPPKPNTRRTIASHEPSPEPVGDEGWIIQAGTPAAAFTVNNKPHTLNLVNTNLARKHCNLNGFGPGTTTLPLLNDHQQAHQRAFLKIQDGCDAHCTYCIIPNLRPKLWSKPVEDVITEAQSLVDAGHREIILTGIFLSAYGRQTALRRRRSGWAGHSPLGQLIEELCTKVPGLLRLRLSSLEPGDLNNELLSILRAHEQVVPHFHLPLQSGSGHLLHRMNRQYTRDDYLRMIDGLHAAYDRPALTTDIIVGFPGEMDCEFDRTLEVVDRAKFIHIHAFSFSPRPGTAAARWKEDFIHGPIVNERINLLNDIAARHSLAFRQTFLGQKVNLLVERPQEGEPMQHGRCERYFPVYFDSPESLIGRSVDVRIDRINQKRTFGTLV
ncbi:MAG TPA: MiaB/RimO family radical SAM methylthiotransferase [Tepidisphaeraceae bacterium]|jgi:threonylcarbamoyladenosine tRNA methylthiotransferase MtaB|nr:MiaB/RimO family radical SAM methylthiotransferase [Tepidisphaeraceae bacterium]HEV8604027.1 MiaB/RimO family radical SAM methylthiotransferase [Tepidisphaeraceae bacterium]